MNTTAIMRRCDPERLELYNARARACCEEIFQYHYKPELGCTLENVGPNGGPQMEHTAGRVVNPGHDIECSWFVMEEANYTADKNCTHWRKIYSIRHLKKDGTKSTEAFFILSTARACLPKLMSMI